MKSPWILRTLTLVVIGICLTWLCAITLSPVSGQFRGKEPPAKGQPDGKPAQPAAKKPAPEVNAAQERAADVPAASEVPPSTLIEIPDEPKTVDPATLVPKPLAARVTVDFKGKPLRDIVKWLQQEQSLNVLVDTQALSEEGLLLGEPITDHSDDAPLYLLLNRLSRMRLDWYFEDETLYITTQIAADEHTTTIPYNLGDIFDAGYKPQSVLRTLGATAGAPSSEDASVLLGDVIFVRQTNRGHQLVAGMLSALRKHGRRTFTLDPPEHEILRQKLSQNVTVQFDETPLNAAIQELSRQVQADLRLDVKLMADEGISERTEVSLKMTDRPLNQVLRALLMKSSLTWELDDGVLWITTLTAASEGFKTAIFDVRDLCRNNNESNGLMRAVRTQTRGRWDDVDGEGGTMVSPKPGVLVVRNDRRTLDDLLKLLESYRAALRISKPRETAEVDPKELIVKYYRLQQDIAVDLERLLPELIQPESWKSPARPDATGTIRNVVSKSGLIGGGGVDVRAANPPGKSDAVLVANSVLIIKQSREIHEAIDKLINKIQYGDAGDVLRTSTGTGGANPGTGMSGMGGGMGGMGGGMGGGGMGGGSMGGMGGGFGGGFFSVPGN